MLLVLENHLSELVGICQRHRVERLEIFGSATREDFDPVHSDLDFLVTFAPMPPAEYARAYFSLLEQLEILFGRDVDLVEAKAVTNPVMLRAINRNRRVLYAA